ncbi:hypothetical protein [Limnohabitans sp. 2KL-17]|uniref:hypothetical protein n=1 Tax=Limnohabitans sp. 2KL-17 TaxID=1100704 RepID=UPI001304A645|nr:hypothetical protein [Limnohabitans sp. 2KL-17]
MNRKTVELLGIWASICNPALNDGEFATIKSPASVTEMVIAQMRSLLADYHIKRLAR